MKVIVIHGDHIEKSSQRIKSFIDVAKNRGWEIERLNLKNNLNLQEKMVGKSLFEVEKLFLLEEPAVLDKRDASWLKKNKDSLEGNFVIFSNKTLSKSVLDRLPKPDKVEEYKLPKLIFKFLEAFYPGNVRGAQKLLHQLTKSESVEFVFALLARHLKDLYLIKKNYKTDLPSWRLNKLNSQAKRFEKEKIKKVIEELSKADFRAKTSRENLNNSLDLIIATQLE